MAMIERGEVNVTLLTIAKLARGLQISLVDLFSELEQDTNDLPDGK
jgi:hypothetical protein